MEENISQSQQITSNPDPQAEQRKEDHIALAFKSRQEFIDDRFYYEPMLRAHPSDNITHCKFIDHELKLPLWVSSMTGGTEWAKQINLNLAKACKEFGMGMGLGSCRSLLYNNDMLEDFNVRKYIGDQPLYTNLGIAQVEELVQNGALDRITELNKKLQADGLIIHVNPMQEWLQPEGDRIRHAPIDTIERTIDHLDQRIIVKEVGQGMGFKSLEALLKLPLEAIEFGAHGGTNFAKLEILRSDNDMTMSPLASVGHRAEDMVTMCNELSTQLGSQQLCNHIIISGGVKDFIDGYYLVKRSKINAIYAQASAFLKHARGEYRELQNYVALQSRGLQMAYQFLQLKEA